MVQKLVMGSISNRLVLTFAIVIAVLLTPFGAKADIATVSKNLPGTLNSKGKEQQIYYFLNGEQFEISTLGQRKVILRGLYVLNRKQAKQFCKVKMGKKDEAVFITTEGSTEGLVLEKKFEKMKLQNVTRAVNRINEGLKEHEEDATL